MLNMLIAVAVGEGIRQAEYRPRTIKSKSENSILRLEIK
jgi:hypothetical protein